MWRYVAGYNGYVNWQSAEGHRIAQITDRYYQLFHRHKLSLIGENECPVNDRPCDSSIPRLNGSLYTASRGYAGPGTGTAEGVYAIGPYGTWGAATYGVPEWRYDQNLFWQHTNNYSTWFQQNLPGSDYFLYLKDEPSPSDYSLVNTWAKWIKDNPGPGHSMSSLVTFPFGLAPMNMPDVDIPVTQGGVGVCPSTPCNNVAHNTTWAQFYRTAPRRKLWGYNAGRPGTATFMTEDDGIAARMIPWGQYKLGIDRWFYWYANLNTPADWFQQAVTWGSIQYYDNIIGFTGDNATSNGDGLLAYPGHSVYGGQTNYNLDGPIASLRMKEWRRGIQDVDYLTLAAKYDPTTTNSVIASTVPKAQWEYNAPDPSYYVGEGPSWSSDPDVWEASRKRLMQVILDHCATASAGSEADSPCTFEASSSTSPTDPGSSQPPTQDGGSGSSSTQNGGSDPSVPTQTNSNQATPLVFVPMSPCRVLDTREQVGDYGAPYLAAHTTRVVPIRESPCNLPSTAQAYALNVTIVPHGSVNFLTVYPAGGDLPNVSLLNSWDGRVKAASAIVPSGVSGSISAFATDATDLVIDVSGYFVPTSSSDGLRFFPIKPCRAFDTRIGAAGSGNTLKAGEQRVFDVLGAKCGVPSSARAYSMNYTAVPKRRLGWVTTWPAGEAMPYTSTLNAPTGAVTANAAITPAGTSGSISVYVTDDTELIGDINGYFAPDSNGGLLLYSLTPCRAFDSRITNAPTPNLGSISVNLSNTGCGVPATIGSVVATVTAVPITKLDFISLGAGGSDVTQSSTLNAYDGQVTSNLAIIPTSGGSISAFTTDRSHVIFDILGYFAR